MTGKMIRVPLVSVIGAVVKKHDNVPQQLEVNPWNRRNIISWDYEALEETDGLSSRVLSKQCLMPVGWMET